MGKYKTSIQYGLIGALVACMFGFIAYLFYHQLFSSLTMELLYGFIALAVGIFIPIWSGVTFKKEQGGNLSFTDAFTAVFITFVIAGVGSSLTSYIIPNVIDKNYPKQLLQQVKTSTEGTMEKLGSTQEQIDKEMDKLTIDKFQPSVLKTLQSFGISMLLSAALSLLIAAFLKRNPQNIPTPNTTTDTQ